MNKQDKSEFLRMARERFRLAHDAESRLRKEALDDLRFRAGDQWPEHIRKQREEERRPCLTLDRLGQFVRQVTNDLRQNRPAIRVSPVDSAGDKDTAEIIQGLIRHIEANSSADIAYDTAAEYAATMGFGYFRLRADWDSLSFNQDILIEAIPNPFAVYLDPAAMRPDRSDARYGFIIDRVPTEEFKRLHPKSETASAADFTGLGDAAPEWFDGDSVQVAEYFHIEYESIEIALLGDGQVVPLEQVPEGVPVVKTRTAEIPRVCWAKITGTEVLEEQKLPGRYIPILPVLGEELIVDGERRLSGVVRTAKDSQAQYNFMASAETEAIALAPKAPYVMAEGQDSGYEAMWAQANTKNFARLVYKPVTIGGTLAPPPQRNVYEPAIQAISMARMQAADDMKAALGMYDAAVGARSNETSGKAILARQKEADTANFHLSDNLSRTLKHTGRILLEWIPVYYDAERVVRIIGEEGDQKTVTINAPYEEKPGLVKLYDLTTGKYDVTVSSGPSYSTKRQEAAESIMQLTQAYPELMQVAGDLLVENMDWPGARAIAERLKKTLPPALQENEGQQPVPPQVQAQLEQQSQMLAQLTEALNAATSTIETKKLENESKERIAALQTQAQLIMTEAKLGSSEAIEMLRQEIAAIGRRLEILNADEPVTEEQSAVSDQPLAA